MATTLPVYGSDRDFSAAVLGVVEPGMAERSTHVSPTVRVAIFLGPAGFCWARQSEANKSTYVLPTRRGTNFEAQRGLVKRSIAMRGEAMHSRDPRRYSGTIFTACQSGAWQCEARLGGQGTHATGGGNPGQFRTNPMAMIPRVGMDKAEGMVR